MRTGSGGTGVATSTNATRRGMTRLCLAVGALAAVALAGCSGGGGARAADAAAKPSSTSSSMSTSALPPAPTASAPVRSQSAGASGEGSGAEQKALPFAADSGPDVSDERQGLPLLVSVTEGVHDGYMRYVFTFIHGDTEGHQPWRQYARPAWDIRYVPQSEVVRDGSGDPVGMGGAAHLKMRFQAARHYQDGSDSLERFPSDEGDLAYGGDFEGQVTWFLGADFERPFRVEYEGDGRVVVDVVR